MKKRWISNRCFRKNLVTKSSQFWWQHRFFCRISLSARELKLVSFWRFDVCECQHQRIFENISRANVHSHYRSYSCIAPSEKSESNSRPRDRSRDQSRVCHVITHAIVTWSLTWLSRASVACRVCYELVYHHQSALIADVRQGGWKWHAGQV